MAGRFSRRESGWLYLVIFGCSLFFFGLGLFVGRGYSPQGQGLAQKEGTSVEPSGSLGSSLGSVSQGRGPGTGDLARETDSNEAEPAEPADESGQTRQATVRETPVLIVDRPSPNRRESEPPAAKEEELLAPGKRRVYTVQVGAFRTRQEANQVVVRLKARGYESTVVEPDSENSFYRICVGQESDRSNLDALAGRLKGDGFPTYVRQLNAELLTR